jgi:hypothetical protein
MQKKRGRKPSVEENLQDSKSQRPTQLKSIGLFDHIKHIQYVKDPNYYDNLSEADRKTFNLFMILRGLSMNPSFIEYAAYLYRYLDTIPPAQFYRILIELYPKHSYKEFYRWIKSSKDKEGADAKKEAKVLDLIIEKYEIPKKEAKDYLRVFKASKSGETALTELIRGFGFSDKEVEEMI